MRRIWTFVWSLSLLSLAGLSSGAETPKYGGRLVFAIRNDINGFEIRSCAQLRPTSMCAQLAYESLLGFDKHGKLVPNWRNLGAYPLTGKSYLFKRASASNFKRWQGAQRRGREMSVDYAMDPNTGPPA